MRINIIFFEEDEIFLFRLVGLFFCCSEKVIFLLFFLREKEIGLVSIIFGVWGIFLWYINWNFYWVLFINCWSWVICFWRVFLFTFDWIRRERGFLSLTLMIVFIDFFKVFFFLFSNWNCVEVRLIKYFFNIKRMFFIKYLL